MVLYNICIPHIPVGYVGGRAPTVGALGDAGAVAEKVRLRGFEEKFIGIGIIYQSTNRLYL
jgi:hypothetical protein